MEDPRVLSIQSHVVRGYVGNKSATFPLQTLGFDVDAINSVQFSNHTQYKAVKGQILNEQDLGDLIQGLDENNLLKYTHLLTGYVGSPSFLNKIASVVKYLKEKNPGLLYICDPVMGDDGRMYVPESLLTIYQNTIVPVADVLTPNQFEIELLTGIKVTNLDEAWKAIQVLHDKGCKTVVLSSSDLGGDNLLIAMASSLKGRQPEKVTITVPKLEANFTGTGDLFSSLLLAWLHKSKGDLQVALENTMCTMQAVVRRTLKKAQELSGGGPMASEHLELQLIQSKHDIENPQPTIRATKIQ